MKQLILLMIYLSLTIILIESPKNPVGPPEPIKKAVALVNYDNTIYHCYMAQARPCGYMLRCNGGLWKQCVEIKGIEYLN